MDRSNANTALASAFTEELARSGVTRAVISPGSRSTPVALALLREPEIDVSVVVDERSAGFYAVGAAQATGSAVAVLCTSGTAAANLHPAVCEADESGVPLIVLTADRPPELRGVGAGQTIDQLALYGSAVRWFCEVGTHDADDAGLLHLRSVACRAAGLAAGDSRPGPVHLNLSWRDPLGPEPVDGAVGATSELALAGRGERPLTAVVPASATPDEFVVSELTRHLSEAARPVIVAGRQTSPELASAVAELAAAAAAPILAEPTSQLRFGAHDRSLVVGSYDAVARLRPSDLEPDFVLRFGEMPTSKALRGWLASLDDAAQIVVDPAGGWNEPTRRAAAMVRADPIALAEAMTAATEAGDPGFARSWLEACRGADEAVAAALDREGELSEPAVHLALARSYSGGELVYTASSMPIRDQEAFAAGSDASVRFLANRGVNGIDGLLSSGIGAARASGLETWILTGDLGLFHDLSALSQLAGAAQPIRVVVFDNGGGGIFEFLPQASQIDRDEFETLFGTPTGLSCERAAAMWEIPYRRVEAAAEIAEGPWAGAELIEVSVDRLRGVELRAELARAATDAVAGALRSGS